MGLSEVNRWSFGSRGGLNVPGSRTQQERGENTQATLFSSKSESPAEKRFVHTRRTWHALNRFHPIPISLTLFFIKMCSLTRTLVWISIARAPWLASLLPSSTVPILGFEMKDMSHWISHLSQLVTPQPGRGCADSWEHLATFDLWEKRFESGWTFYRLIVQDGHWYLVQY